MPRGLCRPHVFTTYDVGVEEPGRVAMLHKLAALEAVDGATANARWQVRSGGEYGWLLAEPEQGFPGTAQHALFGGLSKDLPEGAAISLYSMNFAVMQVPRRGEPQGCVGHCGATSATPRRVGALDVPREERA